MCTSYPERRRYRQDRSSFSRAWYITTLAAYAQQCKCRDISSSSTAKKLGVPSLLLAKSTIPSIIGGRHYCRIDDRMPRQRCHPVGVPLPPRHAPNITFLLRTCAYQAARFIICGTNIINQHQRKFHHQFPVFYCRRCDGKRYNQKQACVWLTRSVFIYNTTPALSILYRTLVRDGVRTLFISFIASSYACCYCPPPFISLLRLPCHCHNCNASRLPCLLKALADRHITTGQPSFLPGAAGSIQQRAGRHGHNTTRTSAAQPARAPHITSSARARAFLSSVTTTNRGPASVVAAWYDL